MLLVVVDCRCAPELCQLAQGIASKRRPKLLVDAIDELCPERDALDFLQAVVPLAGGAVKIEGRRRDLEVFRRAVGAEELLAFVQPRDGIVTAIILGEVQFMAWVAGLPDEDASWVSKRPCLSRIWVWTFLTGAEMRLVSWRTAEMSASMRLPRSPTILTSLSNMESMEAWVAGV